MTVGISLCVWDGLEEPMNDGAIDGIPVGEVDGRNEGADEGRWVLPSVGRALMDGATEGC